MRGKSFSTHGHQSARVIPQTFLRPALNDITYVGRHEKLIRLSRGNVKGNDLGGGSLPPWLSVSAEPALGPLAWSDSVECWGTG